MSRNAFDLKRRALEKAQPLSAHLELTYHCNWRCVFCYNPRHFDLKRMSGSRWLGILDELRALGTMTVSLTGGEPLTHPDFFQIAEGAAERGFAVRIFTNGTLIDDAVANRIEALGPLMVEMSIHGATAEVHDRVTTKPGSFDRLLAAVTRLRTRGVPMLLKTPICSTNEHQLDELIALAASLDVAYSIDYNLAPRDDGDASPLTHRISDGALRRVIAMQMELGKLFIDRSSDGPNCGLGRATIAIDPEGNVYPCLAWKREPLGNLREQSLRELWESPGRAAAAAVSDASNAMLAAAGGAAGQFPYCPAVAAQSTGDALTPDDAFLEAAGIAFDIRSTLVRQAAKS